MFGLETESLQLIVTLLIALFPLVLFLLLQLHHFLERRLGQRRWDIVFTVQILYAVSAMCGNTAGTVLPLRPVGGRSLHGR